MRLDSITMRSRVNPAGSVWDVEDAGLTGFPSLLEPYTTALSSGMLTVAHQQYNAGRYKDALSTCETIYQVGVPSTSPSADIDQAKP